MYKKYIYIQKYICIKNIQNIFKKYLNIIYV